MNPFEFVLLLLAMVFLFSLLKQRGQIKLRDRGLLTPPPSENSSETRLLQDEVQQLKERIKVLERITVEKENSLAREIEDLRNK